MAENKPASTSVARRTPPRRRLRFDIAAWLALSAATPCAMAGCKRSAPAPAAATATNVGKRAEDAPNVILILADDHRYDALGFLESHSFLETPSLDAMAKEGAYLRNAFVTTSLCSPSRASILTGRYMHNHRVFDNNDDATRPSLTFFPQYLQQAGYQTAFIGKWHMGSSDEPRPGFDHWVSFAGQGEYYPAPDGSTQLNVNGEHVPQRGYITDELSDYAIDWLDERDEGRPFFLYLSHKAVHEEFSPAARHQTRYDGVAVESPVTQSVAANRDKPMWVQNQRNSWHGVDFAYHSQLDVKEYFRRYCETLLAVDESVGRVRTWLKDNGLDRNTLVVYMGDNGFLFGEHGLIDKRNAYEESMRVPMLASYPARIPAGTVVDGLVANIDIAPTLVAAAGLSAPTGVDGRSFLPLLVGERPEDWRDYLLYEYYWEHNFPHTPTTFALRGERFKLISYHGIWDTDELYDLRDDPREEHNLICDPAHRDRVKRLRQRLHDELVRTGGDSIRFTAKRGGGSNLRSRQGAKAAEFPDEMLRGDERED
jgi:N-acetylglucosamine-6-sulfatase